MVRATTETEPTFKAGMPETIFRVGYLEHGSSTWETHPDGKRFLTINPGATTDDESTSLIPLKINIVFNFFEELKKRVLFEYTEI